MNIEHEQTAPGLQDFYIYVHDSQYCNTLLNPLKLLTKFQHTVCVFVFETQTFIHFQLKLLEKPVLIYQFSCHL